MEIKILGSGCSKCRSTMGIIERAASDLGVEVEIVTVDVGLIEVGHLRAVGGPVVAGRRVHVPWLHDPGALV